MRSRHFALIVAAALAAMAVVLAHRLWQYERREPVRSGISDMKSGNFAAALEKLLPFADAGDTTAQRAVGEIYAEGLGVPPDPVLAGIWFRRAECECESPGQAEYDTSLRLMQREGARGARDAAATWLVRAAEAGHPRAQAVLADRAELKEKGWVVPLEVSEYWERIIARRRNAP